MKWTDVFDIALELSDQHPDTDPQYVRFVELREWVLALDGFDDDPNRCGEKILESIQAAWMEEVAD
jgi:FeS assembly protein IscX